MGRTDENRLKKLYYSIGEVCAITGVESHVLRFWETEFRELSPRKNRGGKRLYRDADIAVIERIKSLLYEQKYTIAGARKQLRSAMSESVAERTVELIKLLKDIRVGLEELKSLL